MEQNRKKGFKEKYVRDRHLEKKLNKIETKKWNGVGSKGNYINRMKQN